MFESDLTKISWGIAIELIFSLILLFRLFCLAFDYPEKKLLTWWDLLLSFLLLSIPLGFCWYFNLWKMLNIFRIPLLTLIIVSLNLLIRLFYFYFKSRSPSGWDFLTIVVVFFLTTWIGFWFWALSGINM